VLLGALVLGTSCGSEKAEAQGRSSASIPVTVAPSVEKVMPVDISAVGRVEESAVVSVLAQVDGRVEKVHFKEGDSVAKGDLLFTLDRRLFEAALREAVAKRDRDKVLAQNAKSEQRRYGSLVEKGFVSREQADQAETAAAAAEASLRADQSAVESAKLNLQYTTIRSPIDGRTGSLLVDEGNVVKANDKPLVVIRRVKPIHVQFAVPEQYLPRIRERMAVGKPSVQATARDPAAKPARGELTFVENAVDTATGTIGLKALFANEDEALWPGQYVDVVLKLRTEANAVVVPATAVQKTREGEQAFVLRGDGTVELREVVVVRTTKEEAVIGKGIAAGEMVVTDGQLMLVDGARVEVKETRAEARAAPAAAASDPTTAAPGPGAPGRSSSADSASPRP
jgi:multidrug efflux system membrane fusion protein